MNNMIEIVGNLADNPLNKFLNIVNLIVVSAICYSDIPAIYYLLKIIVCYFSINILIKFVYALLVYSIRQLFPCVLASENQKGYLGLYEYHREAVKNCDNFKLQIAQKEIKAINEDNIFSQNVFVLGFFLVRYYSEIVPSLGLDAFWGNMFIIAYIILFVVAGINFIQYLRYDYKIPVSTPAQKADGL